MAVFTKESRNELIQKPFRSPISFEDAVASKRQLKRAKLMDLTFEDNSEFADKLFDCILRLKIPAQFLKALKGLESVLITNESQLMVLTSNKFTKEISDILSKEKLCEESGKVVARIVAILSQDLGCCCDLNPILLIPLLQYGDQITIAKSKNFIKRCKDVDVPDSTCDRVCQILDNDDLLSVSAVVNKILKSVNDDRILQLSLLSPRILISATQINPAICQSAKIFEKAAGLIDSDPDVSLAALCNILRWYPEMSKCFNYHQIKKLKELQKANIPLCMFSSYLLSFCPGASQNKRIFEHLNSWLQIESDPDLRIEIRKRLDNI